MKLIFYASLHLKFVAFKQFWVCKG